MKWTHPVQDYSWVYHAGVYAELPLFRKYKEKTSEKMKQYLEIKKIDQKGGKGFGKKENVSKFPY